MTAEFAVALHSLEYLLHNNKCLSSGDIAENVCTNPARVRKILAKLEKAGLVEVTRGCGGGYILCCDAETTTLCDIMKAVGGSVLGGTWRSGNTDAECMIASGMAEVLDGVFACVEESGRIALMNISLADIDKMLFAEREKGQ